MQKDITLDPGGSQRATLEQVESAYSTKIAAADTEYNERKAFYESLKAKYEANWVDP